MTDPIDRILSEEPTLEPSSGLADEVMRRVLEEAKAPAPLVFPWLRFAAGTALSVLLLAAGMALGWFGEIGWGSAGTPVESWVPDPRLWLTVGLPAGTLILTYVAARFTLRLVGAR